jgi:hypothetical protein
MPAVGSGSTCFLGEVSQAVTSYSPVRLTGGALFAPLAFVIMSPIVAVRLSDSLSVGLIDFAALPLILLALKKPKSAFSNQIGIVALLYAMVLTISTMVGFINNGPETRDLAALRLLFILTPLFYGLSLRLDQSQITKLTKALIWSGSAAIGLGIILHLLGIQVRAEQQMLWTGTGNGPTVRAGGILGNSSDFGHFTSSWGAICGLLVLALFRKHRWLWFSLIAGLALYATWISASRAALLHLLLAYFFAIPFLINGKTWVTILTAIAGAIVLAIFWLPSIELMLPADVAFTIRRLDFLNISGSTKFYQSVRLINWAQLFEIWQNNWMWGIGYKNIFRVYGLLGDNAFLTVLVEFGIITGTLFLSLWLCILYQSAKRAFKSKLGVVLFAIVLSDLFHSLTVDTMTLWYSSPLTYFFIAILFRITSATRGLGTPQSPSILDRSKYNRHKIGGSSQPDLVAGFE